MADRRPPQRKPAVAVYPDSDKIAAWRLEGGEHDDLVVSRSAAASDFEGEAQQSALVER